MHRLLVLCLSALCLTPVQAVKYSGNVAAEIQFFPQAAQFENQFDENLTLSYNPKISHDWGRDDLFSMELFFRADNRDEEREHADIRELKWLHVAGNHEWRIGIDTVFWGVTETQHLVDIINQTDRVEGFDGEDKLGQPMIHYTTVQDWGVFHVFVLPGFREAKFRSGQARLQFPLPIDTDQTIFESSDKQHHIDYALRYAHFIGDTEFGLSLFDGTNRDPVFTPGLDNSGQPVLIPEYRQMTQFGVDLQSIIGDWIWKLESIHRNIDSGSYTAATAGFEYTFYGIRESAIDLGTLMEYSWEDRDENAGVLDNDLFGGLRFAFNDVQSTEILAGIFIDTSNQSKSLRVEANRRLGDSWKLTGELQVFTSIDEQDPLNAFANDDFLLLELAWYY